MGHTAALIIAVAGGLAAVPAVAAEPAGGQELNLGAMVRPAPLANRLADPQWHIWCGAPVKGHDGKYHLFYSRWPRAEGFLAWVTKSEIAYAVADSPMGPYRHVNVALPARGDGFWDGHCTHNPNIVLRGGKYYLYYMGNVGDGKRTQGGLNWVHRNNQRVGVAVAENPAGPWRRLDRPVIDVSPDKQAWDSLCVTNPAAVVRPDGSMLVLYKGVQHVEGKLMGGRVRYGAAVAADPEGPYTKMPGHVFEARGNHQDTWMLAEDAFVWYSKRYGQRYYAVARDVVGQFTGHHGGIALFESADGLHWEAAAHPTVLGEKIRYADGSASKTRLERPALLLDDEEPVALFGATNGYEPDGEASFNVQIPLKDGP